MGYFDGAPLDRFRLDGKVAIITGAASGIGLAAAELFTKVGAQVVVADLNVEAADAAVAAIRSAGGAAIAVQCDVADEVSVKRMFDAANETFGAVDVLVNNAAGRSKAAFMEMTVDEWDQMHHICTRGSFICTREAVRQMKGAGKGGAIVNVSSAASLHPMIFNSTHYDSAKAGVNALTKDCAIEFAEFGIRVNAVLPGGTDTPGGAAIKGRTSLPARGPALTEGRRPMGRRGDPSELACAILFMASPASSFITGQLLAADGGFLVS